MTDTVFATVTRIAPSRATKLFADNGTADGNVTAADILGLLLASDFPGGGLPVAPVALADAASIAIDASRSGTFVVTLAGNRTLGYPANLVSGQEYSVSIYQDTTGGRTLAFSPGWKFPNGVAPILTTAAGAIDLLSFKFDGTTLLGAINKAFG